MNKYSSIKKACDIDDLIFNEIVADFHFKTEKEVSDYLLKRFKQFNVKPAFPPIVGNNNWEIHPKPRNIKLKRGFLILDFGCKVNGYCSDMTRTLFLGKPSSAERKIYGIVLNCQEKSVGKIKPGESYKKVDAYSRKLLGKYKKYFVHSLGHGVGKKIHEGPRIGIKSEDIVKIGEVITIEPGIYLPGKFGIRIEDTLFIGKKIEILTKARKELICVNV
ncbi:MAG TPA: M24 family metallopeptidase [Candidatus Nanoarchaeia archaeon]|nr:M24 family metallopeptidase [Candidatus Nanoarchaeia archaeon]